MTAFIFMIYQTLYDLILSAFFEGVTLTGWIEMICTVLATAGVVFVFVIPFIIVWNICRVLSRY